MGKRAKPRLSSVFDPVVTVFLLLIVGLACGACTKESPAPRAATEAPATGHNTAPDVSGTLPAQFKKDDAAEYYINFMDAPFEQVLQHLEKIGGRRVDIEETALSALAGKRVSILSPHSTNPESLAAIVGDLARCIGLVLEPGHDRLVLRRAREDSTEAEFEPVGQMDRPEAATDQVRAHFNIDLKDADLFEVIKIVNNVTGRTFAISPLVQTRAHCARITIEHGEKTTSKQALDEILTAIEDAGFASLTRSWGFLIHDKPGAPTPQGCRAE